MNKVNFFTELFPLLEDKESIDLKIQRTGDELTVLLVPKIKSKTATVTICGSPEDLNDGFMEQLTIPVEKIKGLVSNAAEVKIEDADDSEEEKEDKKEKPAIKKVEQKKAAAKKSATKKVEEPVAEINPEGKSMDAIEAEIEKQRIEEEEAAKEAAEKAAQEKAEEERISKELKDLVLKGDTAFKACLFREAKKLYQEANLLQPNDKAITEKLTKANKWVEQLINDGVIKEEEVHNVNG